MNRITAARTRLEQSRDLPALLTAAFAAFEDMLQVIGCHEERDETAFAAFVLSAAAAVNGRNRIASAPSLPSAAAPSRPAGTDDLMAGSSIVQVALALARLAGQLDGQLTTAAATAAVPADRIACTHAARHAARIRALLGGAREP